jgi:hypothetical protein
LVSLAQHTGLSSGSVNKIQIQCRGGINQQICNHFDVSELHMQYP